jgi:hypothetical protein
MLQKSPSKILRDGWFMENQMKAVLREFGLDPFKVRGYIDPPDNGMEVSYIERKNGVTTVKPIRISLSREEGLRLNASVRDKVEAQLRQILTERAQRGEFSLPTENCRGDGHKSKEATKRKTKSPSEILRDGWFMENQMKAVLREFGLDPFKVRGYIDPPDNGMEVSYIERKNGITTVIPIRISLSREEGLRLDAAVRDKVEAQLRQILTEKVQHGKSCASPNDS